MGTLDERGQLLATLIVPALIMPRTWQCQDLLLLIKDGAGDPVVESQRPTGNKGKVRNPARIARPMASASCARTHSAVGLSGLKPPIRLCSSRSMRRRDQQLLCALQCADIRN
jgi:hypothetical protein